MAQALQTCRFDSLEAKVVIWHKGGSGNPFYEVQRTVKGKMRVICTTANQKVANGVYYREVDRYMDIVRATAESEEAARRLVTETHTAYGGW